MHQQLPALDSYSNDELELLNQLSPVFKKYRRILQQKEIPKLHQERLSAWCLAAAATLLKKVPSQDICLYWSQVADQILMESWQQHGLDQLNICLFAMGKLGGEELNLSSDVDLLIISKDPATQDMESKVKNWIRAISQTSEFGFLFRVDMDLRPGGRFAPLISSLSQVEDHYWGRGETWERLALIRLRPIIGSEQVSNELLKLRKSFCFRKYLDYSLFSDLRLLRQDIFLNAVHDKKSINIKLSPGGIRDIELMIHALQVIHGGRVTELQSHRIQSGIELLEKNNFLQADESKKIQDFYWQLRQQENFEQSKEDRQTYKTTELSFAEPLKKMSALITEKIGEPLEVAKTPSNYEDQIQWLASLGFESSEIESSWRKIQESAVLSRRASTLQSYRDVVIREFVEKISQGLNPTLGLNYFADFIYASRAKSSLFTVLSQSPNLVRDLAQLFSTSSYASSIVTSRPELIDSLFLQKTAEATDDLADTLENLLDKKFITQVGLGLRFLKDRDVDALTTDLSVLADQIVSSLAFEIQKDCDSDVQILKLGKWGRLEFSFKSDLDFIYIGQQKGAQNNMRFGRRLVSRLTEAHRGGSLYGIDLRLRPNGAAGPLMVTEENLLKFVRDEADAWQRQSYFMTRMDESNIPEKLQDIIIEKGLSTEDLNALRDIRYQLWKKAGPNDLKYSQGGLVDIEFAVQLGLIKKGQKAKTSLEGLRLLLGEGHELIDNYFYLRTLELLQQYILNQSGSAMRQSSWESARLNKLLGTNWENFSSDLQLRLRHTINELKALDPVLTD